jgi:hypothetical protein
LNSTTSQHPALTAKPITGKRASYCLPSTIITVSSSACVMGTVKWIFHVIWFKVGASAVEGRLALYT